MAITKISAYVDTDSRFRSWGKHVTKRAEIDLTQKGGYAINAGFVRADQAIALGQGQYLVCAAETGSRKSHSYDYALVEGTLDAPRLVEQNEQDALISLYASEEQQARSLNSDLYRMGLYIALRMDDHDTDTAEAPAPTVDAIGGEG